MYGISLTWDANIIKSQTSFVFIGGVLLVSLILMFTSYRKKMKQF